MNKKYLGLVTGVIFTISFTSLTFGAMILIPENSLWKYNDSGKSLDSTEWKLPSYDDSSWKAGQAELGYGDGDEATVISFGPNSNNKYHTYYFRRKFTFSDTGPINNLKLNINYDDGFVAYLNGKEVARARMPSGAITYSTLASENHEGGAFETSVIDSSSLVIGANVLAVEVHQQAPTSSDVSFNCEFGYDTTKIIIEVKDINELAQFTRLAEVSVTGWPTYMHDIARSGVTPEELQLPLYGQWVFIPLHAPQNAWSPPDPRPVENILEIPRVDFDEAFHITAVGDLAYFGSSVDNKVYCLDVKTGKVRWSFFTGGPVRLAPTIWEEKVFFGSDDGFVYCLNAGDGKFLWKFRAAPREDKLLGSGKMISMWPVRTGVLVDNGIAYFGAGVFPFEGICLYAVQANDGNLLWKNDSWGYSRGGWGSFTPQGYLLANEKQLYVPCGRALPSGFDRKNGKFLFQRGYGWREKGIVGGSYALLDESYLYSGANVIASYRARSGELGYGPFRGHRLIVISDAAYLLTGKELLALDRKEYMKEIGKLTKSEESYGKLRDSLSSLTGEKLEAARTKMKGLIQEQQQIKEYIDQATVLWRYPSRHYGSMVLAGRTLFVGGENEVIAVNAITGQELWKCNVEGTAKGLAAANGRLFVSSDNGSIYCFGLEKKSSPVRINQQIDSNVFPADEIGLMYEAIAKQIVKNTGIKKGYCLILGCGDGRFSYELAKLSELKIYVVEPDAKKVSIARDTINRTGLYGARITIEEGSFSGIPFSDYFANLIISEEMILTGKISTPAEEIFRMLKPCGGVLYLGQPKQMIKTSEAKVKEYVNVWIKKSGIKDFKFEEKDGIWIKVTRGQIPGAGKWTHQYAGPGNTACAEDKIIKYPLGVLWFGEPGPADLINRHSGAPAPLSINGRFFVQGNNMVMAYDAYNGVELWRRKTQAVILPVFTRGSVWACSEEGLFLVQRNECLHLDPETGETLQTYDLPPHSDGKSRVWKYIAVVNNLLFGSAAKYDRSDMLFAVDIKSGKNMWTCEGQSIDNMTVAIGDGYLYYTDSGVTQEEKDEALQERGERVGNADVRRVVAINVKSGEKVWQRPVDLADCGPPLHAIFSNGILFFCGAYQNGHFWNDFQAGKLKHRRGIALSGKDGKILWSTPLNYMTRPMVNGNVIYAPPFAFDLRTGKEITQTHPVTGREVKFEFGRGHHCGVISGSTNFIYMRSLTTAFYDLIKNSGVIHFFGQRPGCHLNIIAANGLVIEPDYSSGCQCLFALNSTLVFKPREADRGWGMFCSTGYKVPVKHLAVNLGAPGDRRDEKGILWLSYPRPSIYLVLNLELKTTFSSGGGYYMFDPDNLRIDGTDKPWLFSFGCNGITRCTIPLLGKNDETTSYTVRLGFVELDNDEPGKRVFDIKLQGESVAQKFDIFSEAKGKNRAIVREFKGIKVVQDLIVELGGSGTGLALNQMPVLSTIEVIKEN